MLEHKPEVIILVSRVCLRKKPFESRDMEPLKDSLRVVNTSYFKTCLQSS